LEGFPEIPKLVKLCLESNQLKDDSIGFIVKHFPDIQFLSLTANQISTLEVPNPFIIIDPQVTFKAE
jgi:hypothetical protein